MRDDTGERMIWIMQREERLATALSWYLGGRVCDGHGVLNVDARQSRRQVELPKYHVPVRRRGHVTRRPAQTARQN
jgi:hypothetical protein